MCCLVGCMILYRPVYKVSFQRLCKDVNKESHSPFWYVMHTLHIVFLSQSVRKRVLLSILVQREERVGFVCNDLPILCSVAPALCGPALQLSSPAPLAASAGWPELQRQSPGKTRHRNTFLNKHTEGKGKRRRCDDISGETFQELLVDSNYIQRH